MTRRWRSPGRFWVSVGSATIAPALPQRRAAVGGHAVALQEGGRGRAELPEVERDRIVVLAEAPGDELLVAALDHRDELPQVADRLAIDRREHLGGQPLRAEVHLVRQHEGAHDYLVVRGLLLREHQLRQLGRGVLRIFVQEAVGERGEDEAAHDVVVGERVVEELLAAEIEVAHRHLDLQLLAVAQDGQPHLLANLLPADQRAEGARLAGRQADVAVVGDLHAVQRQQHVVPPDGLGIRALDTDDADARLPRLHLEEAARVGVLHAGDGHADGAEAVHPPVRDVREEMADDFGGDHIADVVAVLPILEDDADDFAVVEHRPAAVARIDCRIQLRGKEIIERGMVGLQLDAGDDAQGDGEFLAADGEAHHGDLRLRRRSLAKLERHDVRKERLVIDLQQRQVAAVVHRQHTRVVAVVAGLLLDGDVGGVGHVVRVGQDAVAVNHHSGADAGVLHLVLPGNEVVGLLEGRVHPHHRVERVVLLLGDNGEAQADKAEECKEVFHGD